VGKKFIAIRAVGEGKIVQKQKLIGGKRYLFSTERQNEKHFTKRGKKKMRLLLRESEKKVCAKKGEGEGRQERGMRRDCRRRKQGKCVVHKKSPEGVFKGGCCKQRLFKPSATTRKRGEGRLRKEGIFGGATMIPSQTKSSREGKLRAVFEKNK